MAILALNVSRLTIPQKLIKGQDIITKSTNNPNVPGNTAVLNAFSTAQTQFTAANAAWESAKQALDLLMTNRDTAEAAWLASLTGLGAFTESATAGDAGKIESAGFSVRAEPQPPRPVTQVTNLRVTLTEQPGHSQLRWDSQTQADAYVIQRTFDPTGEANWVQVAIVSEAKYEGNGVTPGQRCWYRVAAVNKLGLGPWSDPTPRPVL